MINFFQENKNFLFIFSGLLVFLCGYSLTVDLVQELVTDKEYLFSDEAVYCAMGYSFAWDQDIYYTAKDLERFYSFWPHGPIGIFLKKCKIPFETICYAKAFIYPLFASPFVRILKTNGFLFFNSILLCGSIFTGYIFLRRYTNEIQATLLSIVYFIFSAAFFYTFWITPEIFNLFMITLAIYLSFQFPKESTSKKILRYIGASIIIGIITYSKLTNILYLFPLLSNELLVYVKDKGTKFLPKKIGVVVLGIIVFMISAGFLFHQQKQWTGDYNYQGGNRKTFIRKFPFQDKQLSFGNCGIKMFTDTSTYRPEISYEWISHNIIYLFIGRFGGMLPYFFPGLIFLIYFIIGEKSIEKLTVLATALGYCIVLIILIPHNFIGGAGTFGNRYFINIYPAFLFLFNGSITSRSEWIKISSISLIFLAGALVHPIYSSVNPADHAKHFAFRYLSPELTCIYNLPSNNDTHYFNVKYYKKPIGYSIFFLDDRTTGNTTLNEGGVWVFGKSVAEFVLKPFKPMGGIVLTVKNGWVPNTVILRYGNNKRIIGMLPGQQESIEIFTKGDLNFKKVSLLKLRVQSKQGFTPYFMDENSQDKRYLGCFIEINILPEEWVQGLNYKMRHEWEKALACFKTLELSNYMAPDIYNEIAECYKNLNKPEQATKYLTIFVNYGKKNQ